MKLPWRSRAGREVELDRELQSHLAMAVALRMERGESRADAERNARRRVRQRHACRGGHTRHVGWAPPRDAAARSCLRVAWPAPIADVHRRRDADVRARHRRDDDDVHRSSTAFSCGRCRSTTQSNSCCYRMCPRRSRVGASDVMSDGTFLELRAANSRAFASFASFGGNRVTLTGVGEPTEIVGAMASANFTRVLGVSPARGRGFADDEETPGSPRVVILGDRMWHESFRCGFRRRGPLDRAQRRPAHGRRHHAAGFRFS